MGTPIRTAAHRTSRALLTVAMSAAVVAGASGSAGSVAAAAEGRGLACRGWHSVSPVASPAPHGYPRHVYDLRAIAGSGSSDVWAVGKADGYGTGESPLIEHWDGSRWTGPFDTGVRVASSGPQPYYELTGVAAVSARAAWAVGYMIAPMPGAPAEGLVYRWNGARWIRETAAATDVRLYGIAGRSSRSVWAVGEQGGRAYAQRWDGEAWSPVSVTGPASSLRAVDVVSDDEAWAVGVVGQDADARAIVQRWDGARWSAVQVPSPAGVPTALLAVSASRSGEVWAVGRRGTERDPRPFALHFDGTRWRIVRGLSGTGDLTGVVATGTSRAWVTGPTVAARYDGSRWHRAGQAEGRSIARTGSQLWVAASFYTNSEDHTAVRCA